MSYQTMEGMDGSPPQSAALPPDPFTYAEVSLPEEGSEFQRGPGEREADSLTSEIFPTPAIALSAPEPPSPRPSRTDPVEPVAERPRIALEVTGTAPKRPVVSETVAPDQTRVPLEARRVEETRSVEKGPIDAERAGSTDPPQPPSPEDILIQVAGEASPGATPRGEAMREQKTPSPREHLSGVRPTAIHHERSEQRAMGEIPPEPESVPHFAAAEPAREEPPEETEEDGSNEPSIDVPESGFRSAVRSREQEPTSPSRQPFMTAGQAQSISQPDGQGALKRPLLSAPSHRPSEGERTVTGPASGNEHVFPDRSLLHGLSGAHEPQPSSATPEPREVPTTGAPERMAPSRVAEMIRIELTRQGGEQPTHELRVQLEPEDLGHLVVHLLDRDGGISAHLQVENLEAKHALEGQLSNLRQELQGQGILLTEVQVSLQNQGQRWGSDRSHPFRKPRSRDPRSAGTRERATGAIPLASLLPSLHRGSLNLFI